MISCHQYLGGGVLPISKGALQAWIGWSLRIEPLLEREKCSAKVTVVVKELLRLEEKLSLVAQAKRQSFGKDSLRSFKEVGVTGKLHDEVRLRGARELCVPRLVVEVTKH